MNVQFISNKVSEWPSLFKELLTRLTVCSLCFMSIRNFDYGISRFGLRAEVWF